MKHTIGKIESCRLNRPTSGSPTLTFVLRSLSSLMQLFMMRTLFIFTTALLRRLDMQKLYLFTDVTCSHKYHAPLAFVVYHNILKDTLLNSNRELFREKEIYWNVRLRSLCLFEISPDPIYRLHFQQTEMIHDLKKR